MHRPALEREGGRSGNGANAPQNHQNNENNFAGVRYLRGDTRTEPYRSEGRDHLKHQLVTREVGQQLQGKDARTNQSAAQQNNGDSLTMHRPRQALTKDVHGAFTSDLRQHKEEKDAEGRDFNAACGTSGAATDKHPEVHEHEGGRVHLGHIDVVEAGCAGRDGLGEPVQDFIGCTHGPEGSRVIPFEGRYPDSPKGKQYSRAVEDELGAHVPVVGVAPVLAKLHEHGKTQATEDDEEADGQQDKGVAGETHEVVGVEGEPGVVEG